MSAQTVVRDTRSWWVTCANPTCRKYWRRTVNQRKHGTAYCSPECSAVAASTWRDRARLAIVRQELERLELLLMPREKVLLELFGLRLWRRGWESRAASERTARRKHAA